MPLIDLLQGSPEWHEYRKARIMATHASSIMGTNHFKSEYALWQELTPGGLPVEETAAMREGTILEPEARKLASELIGVTFEPCVYESDEFNWMAASLDGLSPCGRYILEIKCRKKRLMNMD